MPSEPSNGRPLSSLRWSTIRYRFRESLFQLPALIVVLGVVLAEVSARIDERWGTLTDTPFTLTINSNAATWLLSTIAGAMITTAGVVFSLTVVSLQLASSQFSPRVMRSFIRDRLSQLVIGLLVSSFAFCVLALRHVNGEPSAPAPSVTLTVAVVLAVSTVLLIIAHLNHLANRLQVGEVLRAIADEGHRTIDEVVRSHERERPGDDDALIPTDSKDVLVVPAARGGWVTQASSREMLAAVPPGTIVRVDTRTGAFIHEGEPLVTVSPRPEQAEKVAAVLTSSISVDDTRTMQQDVDFALRQLVDVGLRALSPAVNDPNTAVEVVLRVGSLLRRILIADPPLRSVAGEDDRVLIRPWILDREEYLGRGLDQLRQATGDQTQVLAALMRVVRMLRSHVQEHGADDLVPALDRHLQRLVDAVEGAALHPDDKDRLLAISDDETDPADHDRPAGSSRRRQVAAHPSGPVRHAGRG